MYKEGIEIGLKNGLDPGVIARKIYLSFPTHVFKGKEEMEFELLNSIKEFFRIPFSSIKVVGSSKIEYSYVKNKKFIQGQSDLDVAIVDSHLFQFYCESVFKETIGLTDLSKFGRSSEGVSKYPSYCKYLSKGMFRPDLMPIGQNQQGMV